MKILKRDGSYESLSFDKILKRLTALAKETPELTNVDLDVLSQQVIMGVFDGVSSFQLDELAAQLAIVQSTIHPDYASLASRIVVSNLHKSSEPLFSKTIKKLYERDLPLVSHELNQHATWFKHLYDPAIDHKRDYMLSYFGIKTLQKGYLIGDPQGGPVETPQQMFMRVSVAIHGDQIDSVLETYDLMSQGYFTHASPTLFNAGRGHQQMSSCFLTGVNDSIEGIYKTLTDCAKISKYGGGIGIHVSEVRGKGSTIRGTNGRSDGIVPMLKNFNSTCTYVNQSGKRNGSFAIYIEPWHADILDFLELRKNHGDESKRARDLFYALWIPDAFMRAVEKDEDWYLMSPDECPCLTEVYGEKFSQLYYNYVINNKYRSIIKARSLWHRILVAQIETGTPYMLYKDAVNRKSNQQNLGTIKCSNLCAEICEFTDSTETAVCNLASIGLSKFVTEDLKFNHQKLRQVVAVVVRNLNKVIDYNYYPTKECSQSNKRHRPIGIGVQGLANVFFMLRLPYDSPEAKLLNREIFETIQFAALEESVKLAKKFGKYESFDGSPYSQGVFQHEMWGMNSSILTGRWDWETLRTDIKTHGLRNSLLTAAMPTASTSQILDNFESFEPIYSNIFPRRTLSGEFVVVNKYLIEDLVKLGIWSKEMKDQILLNDGSVQSLNIPDELKKLYKTVWEIKQKDIIDMSVERGYFIDQSQSLNIHLAGINFDSLSSMHFYGWKKGLKTGSYYIRNKAAVSATKFTIAPSICSRINPDCESCSG